MKSPNKTIWHAQEASDGKKWEVTLQELHDTQGTVYLVNRQLPELHIAETLQYRSKAKAVMRFVAWLA